MLLQELWEPWGESAQSQDIQHLIVASKQIVRFTQGNHSTKIHDVIWVEKITAIFCFLWDWGLFWISYLKKGQL